MRKISGGWVDGWQKQQKEKVKKEKAAEKIIGGLNQRQACEHK